MRALLSARATAKINLTLAVHGRRADGYHFVESLVVFAGPADLVHLDRDAPTGVSVTGPFADALTGALTGDNILSRALSAFAAADQGLVLGHVTLDKHLPVAAGIGGGSADAAALLRLLREANPDRANPDRTSRIDWPALALSLGADVPVCMLAQPALMSGIGEGIAPLAGLPPLALLLANPLCPVPATKTRDVFRRLAAPPIQAAPGAEPPPADAAGFHAYLQRHPNDLTAAASEVMPVIADVLAEIARLPACRLARLSGAGPTCFGLFDDVAAVACAHKLLAARRPGWWIAQAIVSGLT